MQQPKYFLWPHSYSEYQIFQVQSLQKKSLAFLIVNIHMSILKSIPAKTSAMLSSIWITEKTWAVDIQEGRKVKKERIHSSAAMTVILPPAKITTKHFPLLSKIVAVTDYASNTFLRTVFTIIK